MPRTASENQCQYWTGHGSASLAELVRELATTRKRGYATEDEGVREGVSCYGAPVFDASGQAVAGIGVCIHKGRLGADRGARHLRMLLEAAQRLSQRLGWDLPSAGAPTAARPRGSGVSR